MSYYGDRSWYPSYNNHTDIAFESKSNYLSNNFKSSYDTYYGGASSISSSYRSRYTDPVSSIFRSTYQVIPIFSFSIMYIVWSKIIIHRFKTIYQGRGIYTNFPEKKNKGKVSTTHTVKP